MAKPASPGWSSAMMPAKEEAEIDGSAAAARRYEIGESLWRSKWLERVECGMARESLPATRRPDRHLQGLIAAPGLSGGRAGARNRTSHFRPSAIALSAERGVKADTSMMSRFFRRIGVTVKKRPLSHASRIARDIIRHRNRWRTLSGAHRPRGRLGLSSMKPGRRPI